ncbi:MAG: hypothetical protein K2H87_01180, partial [Duncaniella sp.]|nr:hypothetical protein [Duncaniella sp.]
AGVGCSFPRRDTIDERIISEAREGTATYEGATYKQVQTWASSRGKTGMIDHPDDVGGWPVLTSAEAPEDTDHDGIPDYWEVANGLNPRNTADGRQIGPDGYTPLDRYLDAIIVEKGPQSGLTTPTSPETSAPKLYNLRGERVTESHPGLILEVTPDKVSKKVSK